MSRDGQMDIDGQRSPIVLPPPSSLEGYRTALPLYAQPPPHAPQRWETKSGSSSSALPSLPSIHSMSRSSSPTTMLPTPVSLPGALTASTSYFSHRDHDREYQAAMREREIKEREREEHRTLRYPSPRVKYERSLSPQLHPSHMQQQQQQQHHHGMPMTMAPPVDPRYYPAHAYRDRGLSDAAIQRMAQEEKDQSVGQTRRLAHLMSEQKRRESINSGFAALRTALPTCHPTDSKAVVLRKAVSRIQQLEQMLGQESSQRYNDHSPNSPEIDNHARHRAGPSERRYNDWEEKPSFDDHPRSHGRPHSQSVSQVQPQASGPAPPNRRQHSHSHSHSESISYPRSVASDNSNGENGENKRGREGQLWQDEPMGNRRRLS